jgi:hypothetical protein
LPTPRLSLSSFVLVFAADVLQVDHVMRSVPAISLS